MNEPHPSRILQHLIEMSHADDRGALFAILDRLLAHERRPDERAELLRMRRAIDRLFAD